VNYRIILLLLLTPLSAKSQESILSKEINFLKTEALALGFQPVQVDTFFTSFNAHLVIPANILSRGNVYYWVLFTDYCSDCTIQMNYSNSRSSKHHKLDATRTEFASIQRLEYTFEKKDNFDIELEAFVAGKEKTILYSILFKKEVKD